MKEGEPLLTAGEGTTSNTCVQRFKVISKKVQGFFDWLPLIVFYALQGSVSFETNSLIPTLLGLFTVLFTYTRSLVDDEVIFPKVLDVGFVVIFLFFTIICFAGGRSAQYLMEIWSNAVMNGLLALMMYISCLLNMPFILAYAIESGMPKRLATASIILYKINSATMEWVYAVALMTVVSCIAPLYLCHSSDDGCYGKPDITYNNLNMIFTNLTQYVILAYMIWKSFYLEPKKRQEVETWTFRGSDEILATYGILTSNTTGKIQSKHELDTLTGVNPLVPGHLGAPVTNKSVDEKLKRASLVIAKAFLHDPMIMKWPQVGSYSTEKRLKACEDIFWAMIRVATPLNHTAFIDDTSYCVAIPCWIRGDEHDLYLNPFALKTIEWNEPPPPLELAILREKLNAALQGRKHIHIALFATDPSNAGKGYGSKCMRAILALADEKNIVTSLETCTTKNRLIYEHYGFSVVGSMNVEGFSDPWVAMIRDVPNRGNDV